MGRTGSPGQGRRQGARRLGKQLGEGTRAPEDQARGRGRERARPSCVREPGLPRGTAIHGEAAEVNFCRSVKVAKTLHKGLNNGDIVSERQEQSKWLRATCHKALT